MMELTKETRAKVIGKAAADAEFRARLLSDPKGAMEQELGVTIPASMAIEVHEEDASTAHLILPPVGALSAEEMEKVAAGRANWQDMRHHPGAPPRRRSPFDFDDGVTLTGGSIG